MWRAEVINSPDQPHPVVQGRALPQEGAPAADQPRQLLAQRAIVTFDVSRVQYALLVRPMLHVTNLFYCAARDASVNADDAPLLVLLDDLCHEQLGP